MKKEAIRYIIAGVATTAISTIAYWIAFDLLMLPNIPSVISSWILAVVFAFFANKLFVFKSSSLKPKDLLAEGGSFLGARIATGLLEIGMMWLLVDILSFAGTPMKLLTNVIIIALNYLLSKFYIFNKKSGTYEAYT